jgi:hypothetical protein
VAKICLGLLVLVAIIAWAANPRACCPKDNAPSGMMLCQTSSGNAQNVGKMDSVSGVEPGMPVKSLLKCSDPMPRVGMTASETMQFALSYPLIFKGGLITTTNPLLSHKKPESEIIAPRKQPPRV